MMTTKVQALTLTVQVTLVALLYLASCSNAEARSEKSFDEIERLVTGRTAKEVLRLLGEPDSQQPVFGSDEKWIWWNYTFLDGQDYPPEIRGRIVHLEIIFDDSEAGALGIRYRFPES